MNNEIFEIALVQAVFTKNVQENIRKMIQYIQLIKTKSPQVKFIVFPELCVTGYYLDEELHCKADTVLGEHYNIFKKIARELDIYICYGYVEKECDKVYNSIILIDTKGNCIGNYRKIQITPLEKPFFHPGSTL